MDNSGRLKLYRMKERDIIDSLFGHLRCHTDPSEPCKVYAPCVQNLPVGYVMRGIYYSQERGCFMAVVEHESFDVVPFGAETPVANEIGEVRMESFEIHPRHPIQFREFL